MTRAKLLALLPPFKNSETLVNADQEVSDIVNEVLYSHNVFSSDYDRLAEHFWTGDIYSTCEGLFDFCKKNISYKVESESDQTSRSPAATLEIGAGDCKHYAGFIAGILDALNRAGDKINWFYRFASYRPEDLEPQHVFVVAKDSEGEIWIDPVLDYFDEREPWPEYYYDKKPKNNYMALRRVSGMYDEALAAEMGGIALDSETGQSLFVAPGSGLQWINGEWYILPPGQGGATVGDVLSTLFNIGASSTDGSISSLVNPASAPSNVVNTGVSIINQISSLFGGSTATAATKIFQMFPATMTSAASLLSAINGAYAHYQTEGFVTNPSLINPTSGGADWNNAYQALFTQYINAYNALTPNSPLSLTKQPNQVLLVQAASAAASSAPGTMSLTNQVPATNTSLLSLGTGGSSSLLMWIGIGVIAYVLIKKL